MQPEGFIQPSDEKKLCKLKRSFYGLKQAPRIWYKKFDTFMVLHGYIRSEYDSCVYYKFLANGTILVVILYVNVAFKSISEIQRLKQELHAEFEIKDLGHAQKILGMEIKRDRKQGMLWLSQTGYIRKVLEKFNMIESKALITHLGQQFRLSSQQCPSTEEEH